MKHLETDGNQTYPGDHFVMYRNIESLCCAPGTFSKIDHILGCKTSVKHLKKNSSWKKIGG